MQTINLSEQLTAKICRQTNILNKLETLLYQFPDISDRHEYTAKMRSASC